MATQHTPGPWSQEVEDPLVVSGCNGRLSVAEVHDHSDTSADHSTAEALANARLIAAAPELLAALEWMAAIYTNYRFPNDEPPELDPASPLAVARAAIAKAKGL